MNPYEAKQAARRERLEAAAARADRLAASMYKSAKAASDVIPFGQPIMVGHYSEGRDRRYRARFQAKFARSFELTKKAEYLRGIAAGVGNAGISSDDPEAVVKLREELATLKGTQAFMVAANKIIRAFYNAGCRDENSGDVWPAYLSKMRYLRPEITEAQAKKLLEADCIGRRGFPDYKTKNNGANIRRIEARIAQLTRERARAVLVERELEGGIKWREDPDENRLMLIFPGKPPEATRSILKANGFRWSPTNSAWQRQLNNGARQSAEWAVRQILGKPTASAGAEVAAFIDPTGGLQAAGLLKVEA